MEECYWSRVGCCPGKAARSKLKLRHAEHQVCTDNTRIKSWYTVRDHECCIKWLVLSWGMMSHWNIEGSTNSPPWEAGSLQKTSETHFSGGRGCRESAYSSRWWPSTVYLTWGKMRGSYTNTEVIVIDEEAGVLCMTVKIAFSRQSPAMVSEMDHATK